jgi:methylmalonyl-CoA mutase
VSGSAAASRPVRVVTAAALFDGHDAAIHIMRRILQAHGAEVIHLGHDRSVAQIATAAIQEDADAIAVSSYQGGHLEFFRYLLDELRRLGAGHVRVYGGGGGTILPDEIQALEAYGVSRLFSPEDGRRLGLAGMIDGILRECAGRPLSSGPLPTLRADAPLALAETISRFEAGDDPAELAALRAQLGARTRHAVPVIGITGTGGAGKSSVVDELLRRLRHDAPDAAIGLLLVDPTRRKSGGALLGDRIRLNALHGSRIYARSLATRQANRALSAAVGDALAVLQATDFDLLLVETAGIGQSDSEIVEYADLSVYVMTPEYGAPSQLEKIDMLELADAVVLNKFDRQGGADALRDVRKQWRRNHEAFQLPEAELPVFATVASRFRDAGVDAAYAWLRSKLPGTPWQATPAAAAATPLGSGTAAAPPPRARPIVPSERGRYLAEIAAGVRAYHAASAAQAARAGQAQAASQVLEALGSAAPPALDALRGEALAALEPTLREQLEGWPERRARYAADRQSYAVRGQSIEVDNHVQTLSHSRLPRVALPRTEAWSELTRYLRAENLPGHFPFTAGVFPFKRRGEEPGRMFAGEGGPERTNRRFHYVSRGQPAVRLSTAFDSVTLYGRDPAERPDVYGKVGTSGVSVCTLDDAKKLYSGFDLCDPQTSVSMTINGPAPMILAFYLNAAIDQQVEKHLRASGQLEAVRARFDALPRYEGALPDGHDGLGLGLLGIPGRDAVDAETYARIRAETLRSVRGTVQADILKEDQAQNTCIFSTEFALSLMGDIQEFFVASDVRNFYSVSISGYHIAEAGANPITQLALTLANGFTYAEYYLSRGMKVDDFAPNFSFFFSNGLDAEYSVIGRVARRIWAIAMRDRYGAAERSQKLKYHVQTSGRSLHAQEMAFNDIRTTLQALTALQDNCNSLHTNAYDEAVTTPTEDSVRRALAIQHIINRELGVGQNENPLQGSYLIEELTELVESAVLAELERLSERGGVLGAMETLYQRSKIQEESLHYETLKHSGALPIVGVNTFEHPDPEQASARPREVMRASDAEKAAQLASLQAFQAHWRGVCDADLERLRAAAARGENLFAVLMDVVPHASLGQLSNALFEVGGEYRRAM